MAVVPTPRTWVTGETVTAAELNSNIRDSVNFLIAPPECVVRQAVVQTLSSSATGAITMDTEDVDTDGMHSTVTNTSRLTAVTAGRYLPGAVVAYAANGTGSRMASLGINGTRIVGGNAIAAAVVGGVQTAVVAPAKLVYLNVGDYLEVLGRQDSGGNLNTYQDVVTASMLSALWVSTT